jgi:hypothetical protein
MLEQSQDCADLFHTLPNFMNRFFAWIPDIQIAEGRLKL